MQRKNKSAYTTLYFLIEMFWNCKYAGYSMQIVAYFNNGYELWYYLTCVLFRVHQTNLKKCSEKCSTMEEHLKTVNND